MPGPLTPAHRGGSGPPLVLLHGFMETWRSWSRVLAPLERRHDVLALTLPGHAGGPPLPEPLTSGVLADAVEAALDAAGIGLAHVAGSSLGGHVALQLAERGRARSVVALAPAGGWAAGDDAWRDVLGAQEALLAAAPLTGPHADVIASTEAGRRRVLADLVGDPDGVPAEVVADLIRGAAGCRGGAAMLAHARTAGWPLDPAQIGCPVRVVWGTADRLLPWPSAAARFRHDWLPHADWVLLDGAGHAPQLERPLEVAELIAGWTGA